MPQAQRRGQRYQGAALPRALAPAGVKVQATPACEAGMTLGRARRAFGPSIWPRSWGRRRSRSKQAVENGGGGVQEVQVEAGLWRKKEGGGGWARQ